jgi:hypothetical protein
MKQLDKVWFEYKPNESTTDLCFKPGLDYYAELSVYDLADLREMIDDRMKELHFDYEGFMGVK